ncbi:MAG: glycosyltransferase family 39 protein [Candidatus Woesearchaeota archaeon]
MPPKKHILDNEDQQKFEYLPLTVILIVSIILRLAWFNAMVERDEGLFAIQGKLLLNQGSGSILTNKPPLLTLIYGIIGKFFGETLIPVRIFNNLLFILSVILFYIFIYEEYDKKIAILATFFYSLLMNLPIFEGMLAMSESLSIFPIMMSVYLFYHYEKRQRYILLLSSILFASVGFLIKFSNIFVLLVFLSYLGYKKELNLKKVFLIMLIFLFIPLIIHFSSAYLIGSSYYLGIWPTLVRFYSTKLSHYVPWQFTLFLILESSFFLFLLLMGIVVTIRNGRAFSKKINLLFFLWLLVGLLFCFIPPSFGHYFIVILPPLAFYSARGMSFLIQIKKVYIKLGLMILLIIAAFTTLFFTSKQYPDYNINYKIFNFPYSDFSGAEEQNKVISFIKEHTNSTDRILVYGWAGEIYFLSQKDPFKALRFVCYSDDPNPNLNSIDHDKQLEQWNPKLLIVMPQYPLECNGKKLFQDFIANSTLYQIGNVKIYIKK